MPCVMATTLFWITFLTSVYFRVVAGTSLVRLRRSGVAKWPSSTTELLVFVCIDQRAQMHQWEMEGWRVRLQSRI